MKGVNVLSFVPGATGIPGVVGDGTQLKSGTHTFTVSGGADVGPVTDAIDYPRSFEWNHDSITLVNRSQPLNITWTGGTTGALVSILGNSAVAAGASSDIGVPVLGRCHAGILHRTGLCTFRAARELYR